MSSEETRDEERPLKFYYNRERRIAAAPQIVQDYYAGKNAMPRGFFKVLVATPGKKILFFSIIALCVLIIFLTYSVPSGASGTVSGVQAELSAFSFEDTIYISIHLEGAKKSGDAQEVRAEISAWNAEDQLFEKQILEKIYTGEEVFLRTKVSDYDIIRVEADLIVSGQKKTLKSSITRK